MKRGTVVLVDPLSSGTPMRALARANGFRVAAIYTLDPVLLESLGCDRARLAQDTDEIFLSSDLDACAERFAAAVGVIPCSEPGVELAARLASRLGLPGNDPAMIVAARDKAYMREAVRAAGLRGPAFALCHTPREALAFAHTHGFPCIVKTTRGAGGSNVRRCHDAGEVEAAFEAIATQPDVFGNVASGVLVEQFIGGDEIAINLFFDGERGHAVDAVRYEKGDTRFGRMLYLSVSIDSHWTQELTQAADYALAVAEALHIRRGAAHVELKRDARGPVLIELGARFAGGGLSELCSEFSDFPLYQKQLEVFTRGTCEVSLPARYRQHAAIALCPSEQRGRVTQVLGLDVIQGLQSYRSHALSVQVGASIAPTIDLNNNPLSVRLAHTDPQQLARDIAAVHRSFTLTTDADRDENAA